MPQNDKDDSDNSESDLEAEEKNQKEYLKNLGKADPEFYKFLQEEGDESLLNPQDDDSDDEGLVTFVHLGSTYP